MQDVADVTAANCVLRFAWKFRKNLGLNIIYEIRYALRISAFNRKTMKRPYIIPVILLKLIYNILFTRRIQN